MPESITNVLYPVIWLTAGILLAILEAATVQLVAIWFSLGSVAAIVPALLGASFRTQFAVFLLVSLVALALTRPFAKKFLKVKAVPTNADQVIGQAGKVVTEIRNQEGTGRVYVMGLDWAAYSEDGSPIPAGATVQVLAIEGVRLKVRPVPQREHAGDPSGQAEPSAAK